MNAFRLAKTGAERNFREHHPIEDRRWLHYPPRLYL